MSDSANTSTGPTLADTYIADEDFLVDVDAHLAQGAQPAAAAVPTERAGSNGMTAAADELIHAVSSSLGAVFPAVASQPAEQAPSDDLGSADEGQPAAAASTAQADQASTPTPAAAVAAAPSKFASLAARFAAFAPPPDERPPSSDLGFDEADDDDSSVERSDDSPQVQTLKLRGLVDSVKIYRDTWGIAQVWLEDGRKERVSGDLVGELRQGLSYEFSGHYRSYNGGETFAAASATPHLECDRRAMVRYMARSFNGVGERTADKFLAQQVAAGIEQGRTEQEVLEEVRQTLVTAPWTLDLSAITSKAEFSGDRNANLVHEAVKRDLATRIGRVEGVKEPVLKELAGWLVRQELERTRKAALEAGQPESAPMSMSADLIDRCWKILAADPYAALREVPGYGFKTADAIGAAVGIAKEDPARLAALAGYAVSEACSNRGHMYLLPAEMADAVKACDAAVNVNAAVKAGVRAKLVHQVEVARADGSVGHIYYGDRLMDVDHRLASALAEILADPCEPLAKKPEQMLREQLQGIAKRLNPNLKDGLDGSQLDALVGILTSRTRLHTITAGPGCGKTSIMEVLTAYLGADRFDYCAPTGRAALVLGNRLSQVGGSASTIHSLFKVQGDEFAGERLESDILVVDEGSMPSAALWAGMLENLAEGQHVIVLGDVGQLPSIEPGRVLDDLLQIPQVDKHRLTASHRSAGGLLEILGQINEGRIDCKSRDDVKFSHGLPPAARGFDLVAREYMDAVGEHGYAQVALLMSRRKGDVAKADWNVTYANARLRELCNPNAPKIPGTKFHVNDRIILRANKRVPVGTSEPPTTADEGDDESQEPRCEVNVVNGDTGTVTDFVKGKGSLAGARWLRIKLDDGRDVWYPSEEAIDHSYAITVHSAQGGEYRRVIAVVTPGNSNFVNQVMLRTQLSRARQLMTVHADDMTLRMVASTPMPPRNSRLPQLVHSYMAQGDSEEEAEAVAPAERLAA